MSINAPVSSGRIKIHPSTECQRHDLAILYIYSTYVLSLHRHLLLLRLVEVVCKSVYPRPRVPTSLMQPRRRDSRPRWPPFWLLFICWHLFNFHPLLEVGPLRPLFYNLCPTHAHRQDNQEGRCGSGLRHLLLTLHIGLLSFSFCSHVFWRRL